MMNSGPPSYSSAMGRSYNDYNPNTPGNNEFSSGPLNHLSESVNSLDSLNAMEKSLNEQVSSLNTPRYTRFYCRNAIFLESSVMFASLQ